MKRPLLLFLLIVGSAILILIGFIQSTQFANVVKRAAVKYIPGDLGVDGDFKDFELKFFPPGVSVRDPELVTSESNVLGLPGFTKIKAEKLELTFLPFQMFSGDIRINQVKVVGGQVSTYISKKFLEKREKQAKRKFIKTLSWGDFLQVRTDTLSFERTLLEAKLEQPDLALRLTANRLSISQFQENDFFKFLLDLEISNVEMLSDEKKEVPRFVEYIKGIATVDSSGVILKEFQIKDQGLELNANGKVLGDILTPKELLADAQIQFKGDLQKTSQLFNYKNNFQGDLFFEGEFKTDLINLNKNFNAKGKLRVDQFKYQKWLADRIAVDGEFFAKNGVYESKVEQAVIESDHKNRVGGHSNALGGRIELSDFKYRSDSKEDIRVQLKLTDAHIQWLTSGVADVVHSLDTKLSGDIDMNLAFKNKWLLKASLDLHSDVFNFDNQRIQKTRPIHRVLRIPNITIKGDTEIDENEVRFLGTQVDLNSTNLIVGGKVHFKNGYDITADGPVNLSEVDEISENKISGVGQLKAHVYGPANKVIYDFNLDLTETYYLNLEFGNFKGLISYDDDLEILNFKNIKMQKGQTIYAGDGYIDISEKDKVDIDIIVSSGYIQEFSSVFVQLTKKVWWFPDRLRGSLSGNLKISGGVGLDKLKVLGKLSGPNWEYFGERFRSVELVGGYDRGNYILSKVTGVKRTGQLDGYVTATANGVLNWSLSSRDLFLSDLDFIALFDVPMRGSLLIESKGSGAGDKIQSETNIKVQDFSVRGAKYGESLFKLKTSDSVMSVIGSAFSNQGVLDLNYSLKEAGSSKLRAQLKDLDFSPLMLIVNPKLMQDSKLQGKISGELKLDFLSGKIEKADGLAVLNSYIVAKSGAQFELTKPVTTEIKKGDFKVSNLEVRGQQGYATFQLASYLNSLKGDVSGSVDLSVIEFLVPSVAQASGPLKVGLDIGGSIKAPILDGKIELATGQLKIAGVNGLFENIDGLFLLKQNIISIKSLYSDFSGSKVSVGGSISLFADQYPKLSLRAMLNGNKIEVFPFQYIKVRGPVLVSGFEIPYNVEGNLVIDSALIKESFTKQRGGTQSQVALYLPTASLFSDNERSRFKLNIKAAAERGVLVKNELFDAEFKGAFTLVNTITNPRVLGKAELIQGSLNFKDTSFQIQNLDIDFDSPTQLNPKFNFNGSTEVNNTKINMYATGRVSQYKVELTSNPVLPESEILQLLTLGISQEDSKKVGKKERGTIDQTEAASVLLHSMDFNRDVQDKTGFKIDLEQAGNIQDGTSVFRPKSETDSTSNPKIVVKRQVGKRVELSFGSTVGVGASTQKEVNAEFKVTPGFSVIGVWDNIEATSTQQEGRTSYGVDLKLQKRFK